MRHLFAVFDLPYSSGSPRLARFLNIFALKFDRTGTHHIILDETDHQLRISGKICYFPRRVTISIRLVYIGGTQATGVPPVLRPSHLICGLTSRTLCRPLLNSPIFRSRPQKMRRDLHSSMRRVTTLPSERTHTTASQFQASVRLLRTGSLDSFKGKASLVYRTSNCLHFFPESSTSTTSFPSSPSSCRRS